MEVTPENVQQLTESEINAASREVWEKLYETVDRRVGSFLPIVWADRVAAEFKAMRKNPKLMNSRPPHFMLRSIEANAASTRRRDTYSVTDLQFHNVMSVYLKHNDPLTNSYAANDLTAMLILFFREQFELQAHFNISMVARFWSVFVDGNPLPSTTRALATTYGIKPLQWMQLSHAMYAAAEREPRSRIEVPYLRSFARDQIDDRAFEVFVTRSVWTPTELGDRYSSVREKTQLQFHSYIPSAFLERPGLDFGEGRLIVPDPELVPRHMRTGLAKMLAELWKENKSLRGEFSDSVERHIGRVIRFYRRVITLHHELELQRWSSNKVCDFLIETQDEIILVESKAVEFGRTLLFPKQMQEDASTTRIIDGCEQLSQALHDLRAGVFDVLIADSSKPVVCIVVTFGEVPYVNSRWYKNKVLMPRVEFERRDIEWNNFGPAQRPIVMSVETLEMFVTVVNSLGLTPTQLISEKNACDHLDLGEWGNYLKLKISGSKQARYLPYVELAWNAFHGTVGL